MRGPDLNVPKAQQLRIRSQPTDKDNSSVLDCLKHCCTGTVEISAILVKWKSKPAYRPPRLGTFTCTTCFVCLGSRPNVLLVRSTALTLYYYTCKDNNNIMSFPKGSRSDQEMVQIV